MNFYDFKDISSAGDCERYVTEVLGITVRNHRCRAEWRGGNREDSIALKKDEWYDHVEHVGGGIVQLCALTKFGGDIQQAQNWLGEWLHLEPKMKQQKRPWVHHDELLKSGYHDVKEYVYADERGNVIHKVIRMERTVGGIREKTFLQCTPYKFDTNGVNTILYNLANVKKADRVVVVEGEKDADTINGLGIGLVATTNACGAKNWKESYSDELKGKDIVICRDNDEAGYAHAAIVMHSLSGKAKSIKCICPSKIHKGDVTDWIEKEGGDAQKLVKIIEDAPAVTKEDELRTREELALIVAKDANKKPFSNVEKIKKTENGHDKTIKKARTIGSLVDDVHARFLEFPRKIGDSRLFDHDRDSGRIEFLDNKSALVAWIGRKSKQVVEWDKTIGAASKDELFEGLVQSAKRYESISPVPDWPLREDCYYCYSGKVSPTFNHSAFDGLVEFFSPADDASEILLRVLFAAPIYYRYGVQRPCWIIDSKNGPGVGKTTVVELLAYLYGCSPIKTSSQELNFDYKELLKRIVSSAGRNSRILLVDNVVGSFRSEHFAEMVTGFGISGRSPYGHGEETRPNNLTYIITANSASINNDIASRSFILFLKKPVERRSWKHEVMSYIEKNRLQILGDIIDIIGHPPAGCDEIAATRVPEFEREVMRPVCGTHERYSCAINALLSMRRDDNLDEELARQAQEIIESRLGEMSIPPDKSCAFIRTEVVEAWLKDLKLHVQDIRTFAMSGLIEPIDKNIRRWPDQAHGERANIRSSGIMWIGKNVQTMNANGQDSVGVQIVGRPDGQHDKIVSTIFDAIIAKKISSERGIEKSVSDSAVDIPAPSAESAELDLGPFSLPTPED